MLTIDQTELADRLRLAVGRLARRLRQQSLGDITPSQRSVLHTLDRYGEMTMSELANIEAVSRPSVTGIVSRLTDRNLVAQRPHDDDGRSSVVDLTSTGSDFLETGRKERTAYLSGKMADLSTQELEILDNAASILDRMVDER
ncbi:MAG: MarR family transcriptional regulator [Acidimicrobiia bacterium]|nr:MarR family transcriptional regulator [Acidimicrobiia bacterium]